MARCDPPARGGSGEAAGTETGNGIGDGPAIAGFRDYLLVLARTRLPRRLRAEVDPSDLVQETLLHAQRDRDRFRGGTEAELAGWLRKILACRLIDRLRRADAAPPAWTEGEFERSSVGLLNLLAADQSTPSARLAREEAGLQVARLLAGISEAQAEAIVLRHCEGWPVDRIGRHMGRTPDAVGGLLRHGLKALRERARDGPGGPP